MKIFLTVLITLLVALGIGAAVIHGGGLTNFAGDEPHSSLINGAITFARERFIAARSEDLDVPDLADPARVADGAAHYVPMCAGCHLGPGTQDTEIRRGLYPQPPNLAQPSGHAGGHDHSDMKTAAARQFWIIKHGIKMTGMPAWGTTHDDEAIWGLVAFLQHLPEMSPEEFAALSAGAAAGAHGHSSGAHEHGTQPEDMQGMGGMEGMEHGGETPQPAAAPGNHVDPPGSKPHSHGAKPQPEVKEDEHHDGQH